jgi:ribosomal protein L11 methyltransferase
MFPIIEPGALHLTLRQRKTKRLDQMQNGAGRQAGSPGVPGVPVNFGMHEHDVYCHRSPSVVTLPCDVPYRVDISSPPHDAFDRLVQLGALDIEPALDGLAAIIPDSVTPEHVARALDVADVAVSSAVGRDNASVWLLGMRTTRVGPLWIAPADAAAGPNTLRLSDSAAFGSGHHPTTALCIEALAAELAIRVPDAVLDVGTGSGVLALAALILGVPRAVGVDVDADALNAAAHNARLNHFHHRLRLAPGGPDAVQGAFPLVLANVLAAPLIEMAPALVRRVGSRGRLIMSGIPASLQAEVRRSYERLGMRHCRSEMRAGWAVQVFETSW